MPVRERAWETSMRDVRRQVTPARKQLVRELTATIIHGGQAYLDAEMLIARGKSELHHDAFAPNESYEPSPRSWICQGISLLFLPS